ncbi:helix-turn-helix domain-containing protein [Bacillus sp. JJ1122]|uniref:helix-turn-helix domain-containing protein n=1 Tax=Bacillus sp. JJ1122 TaxID=3122951 RepID=UPI002FFF535E
MRDREDYPIVLKVDDIQEILHIGRRKAYEVMNTKDFPGIKMGRLRRVSRESFFLWLDKKGNVE